MTCHEWAGKRPSPHHTAFAPAPGAQQGTAQPKVCEMAFCLQAAEMLPAAAAGLQAAASQSQILGKAPRILKLLPALNCNQVTVQEVGKLKVASRNTSSGDEKQSLRVWVSLGCVVRHEMIASLGNSSQDVSENIVAVIVF